MIFGFSGSVYMKSELHELSLVMMTSSTARTLKSSTVDEDEQYHGYVLARFYKFLFESGAEVMNAKGCRLRSRYSVSNGINNLTPLADLQ